MTTDETMKVIRQEYNDRMDEYCDTVGAEGTLLTMSAMYQIMHDVTEKHIGILQNRIKTLGDS